MVRLRSRYLWLSAAAAMLLFAACSGGDDSTTPGAGSPTAGATKAAGATSTAAPTSAATKETSDGGALDICALIPQKDVETAVGAPVGAAKPDPSPPPFFGCRYEQDGITSVITISVIVHDDADDAKASFEVGADQYPAVEDIGDRAYNSQPIDDITVLDGRYEIAVGIYFGSDDNAAELKSAKDLAALVIERLP